MNLKVVTNSPQETIELGKAIGSQLKGGEVFSLVGNLGSGKTHFIKGIVAGVEGDNNDMGAVNSPTFVLINEYLEGRLDVFHIDAYRLNSIQEFENLGFDDLCYEDSVVMIEWADKVEQSLKGVEMISVNLSHHGETQRELVFDNLPDGLAL